MRKIVSFISLLVLLAVFYNPVLAQAPAGQAYVVQPGDRLTSLAEQFLGDPQAYHSIVEATNAKAATDDSFTAIGNPNLLQVGQKLWLPISIFTGTYHAELPAASSPGREMTLELQADGTAKRTTDYLNGEPPIVESGTWTDNGDGTATVTLTGRPDGTLYEAPDVIKFKLENDVLIAVEYDQALYGSEGLTLPRQIQSAPTLLPEEVIGIYKSMMPGASSPGLDSILYLSLNGQARQVSDYLNDEPPIVETGRWEIVSNQVVVTLTGQPDRLYESPVVTTYAVDHGVLVENRAKELPGAYVTHYLPFEALALGLLPVPYDAAAAEQMLVQAGYGGIYKGFLPAATCCGQDITVTFNPDGRAWLKTNFLNGEPPIVQTGTWKTVSDTRLDVTLEGTTSPLMLERVNGVLKTTADEDEYGQSGLTLYEYGIIALNSNLPTVSGTITYLPRLALAPDTLITVQLVDVTRADAPAEVISQQVITAGGQRPPFAFKLAYNPRTFDPTHTYAVQVRIEVNGELQYINTSQVRVLTQGAPSTVEVTVEPVGATASRTTDSCAAAPVTISQEAPPDRASYLAYESGGIVGSEILGTLVTIPGDSAEAWRDGVLGQLGYCTGDASPQEFAVYDRGSDKVVVVFFVNTPFDDSVAGQQIRLDLTRQADQQWRVEWGGVRFLCGRGANTTELTAELCP